MKKIILVGIGVLIIGGVILNLGSSDSKETASSKEVTTSTLKKETESSEEPKATDTGDLGKYHAAIKELSLAADYNGEDVAVVDYEFTNNSEKNAIFLTSINAKAFQNGVALEQAIMTESGYVDSLTEIQPGATLLVKVPYKLADVTSPVTIEVTKLIDFDGKEKLIKEFTLQ